MKDIGKSRRKVKCGTKTNVQVSFEVPYPLNKNDVPSRTRNSVPSHNKYSPECPKKLDQGHTITMPYLVTTAPTRHIGQCLL
jgi:hypothetical protein